MIYSQDFSNLQRLKYFFKDSIDVFYTAKKLQDRSKFSQNWTIESLLIYTVLHMFRQVLFGAGNQGNHQNFEKSLLTNKL